MYAVRFNETIRVYDAYLYRECIKEIPGRFYDANEKTWVVPLTEENVATLRLIGANLDEELSTMYQVRADPVGTDTAVEPMPLKVKPYRHQIAAFNFVTKLFKERKGAALLADMGTGKTLISIAIAGALTKRNIRRMLVVSPKTIMDVWEEEFRKFADYPYALAVLDGDLAKKRAAFEYMMSPAALQVIVVGYESCWRMEKEITKWNPDFIVCDESTKIKNPMAKQAKALHNLGRISKYNMILTGTPFTNGPLDIFSQYKFIDDSIFGKSFYGFRAKYAIVGGYGNHQIVGYKNLAELAKKVHSVAYRIRIEDAVELPPFIDETRYIRLEPSALAVYEKLQRDCYAELECGEITVRTVLTQLLRLSQCTGGFIRTDEAGAAVQVSSAKLEALEDIVGACIDERRKVVVFARFVPEIEAIEQLLKKKGIGYSLIMGSVKDRAEEVRRFQEDPEIKVFVGQLQTVGMGLTLTAASVAVFYSLDYSYTNYEQSRARIHRIGQTDKCLYIHLVCKQTSDEKVMAALAHKGDVAKLMTDDYKKLLKQEDDIGHKTTGTLG